MHADDVTACLHKVSDPLLWLHNHPVHIASQVGAVSFKNMVEMWGSKRKINVQNGTYQEFQGRMHCLPSGSYHLHSSRLVLHGFKHMQGAQNLQMSVQGRVCQWPEGVHNQRTNGDVCIDTQGNKLQS